MILKIYLNAEPAAFIPSQPSHNEPGHYNGKLQQDSHQPWNTGFKIRPVRPRWPFARPIPIA